MLTKPAPHPHVALLIGLTVGTCIVDQATKAWVRLNLGLLERIPVLPGFLEIVHVENRGMAWGLLTGHPLRLPLVTFASLATFVVMLGWFRRLREDERSLAWSLGLVLAGASGNFIDRLLYRQVTDFVELTAPGPLGTLSESLLGSASWAVFNVADVGISLGLVGFVLLAARGQLVPPGLESP
ncbi:MAG: signal peptidase II [Deltaproteobacteria bacterium]|nr:signal peptidase II [Deltaproteobacteria bacterium]